LLIADCCFLLLRAGKAAHQLKHVAVAAASSNQQSAISNQIVT
jgi:hypothetical protein